MKISDTTNFSSSNLTVLMTHEPGVGIEDVHCQSYCRQYDGYRQQGVVLVVEAGVVAIEAGVAQGQS
jgi:hypothetical protein